MSAAPGDERPAPRPGIIEGDEGLAERVDREPGLWAGLVEIHGDIVGSDPEVTEDFSSDPDTEATP